MAGANERLQQLAFDGLPSVPCRSVGLDFEHSLPVRSYPYVDGDGHDNTGRRSATMPVQLLFLNTLTLEQPGVILFPSVFNQWLERLLDGRAGNLEHPIFGNRRARVARGSVPLVSEVRDGVIVDVTFVETLDEPEQQVQFSGPETSVAASALAAQEACDEYDIDYPDGESDGTDLVSAVRGVIGQLDSTATQIDGTLNRVMGNVTRMLDDAEALNDHHAYAAVDNLTTLWAGLRQLKEHLPVQLQRAVGEAATDATTTLDKIARLRGNRLEDIVNLNPQLLAEPAVPKGVRYKYFLDKIEASASFVRS
jgi:prophage DNA circulation protein